MTEQTKATQSRQFSFTIIDPPPSQSSDTVSQKALNISLMTL